MNTERGQRIYDHRLIRLVQETGDASIATGLGLPHPTVAGRLRRTPQAVPSTPGVDASTSEPRSHVAGLEKRVARPVAIVRALFAVLHVLQPDLMPTCAGAGDRPILGSLERQPGRRR